jgi:hypothetical protein
VKNIAGQKALISFSTPISAIPYHLFTMTCFGNYEQTIEQWLRHTALNEHFLRFFMK